MRARPSAAPRPPCVTQPDGTRVCHGDSGTNTQADLTTWYGALNAGEPYDSNPEDQSIVQQIAQYHLSYYLLDGAYGTGLRALHLRLPIH